MATATSSEAAEGPVMSLISKRLRALRKKLNRISQMEETLSQGKKILNAEQQEVLRSKPSIFFAVNELEKLRPALSLAVDDEIALATKNKHYECQDQILAEAEPVEDPSCVKITATPETTVDIAAAAGNYSTFETPVETVLLQSEVDSLTVEVLQEGEEAAVCQENGTYDSLSNYVEEAPKDKEPSVYQSNETYDSLPCDVEQAPKVELEQESKVTGEPTENNSQEEEEDSGEFGWKSNVSRKNYNRSGRGGGRRGFPNGRGARGSSSRGGGLYYSNNGQNYENGNFYPRSYYNNSKGRGRGRSGNVNNNHGSGAQVAYTAVES